MIEGWKFAASCRIYHLHKSCLLNRPQSLRHPPSYGPEQAVSVVVAPGHPWAPRLCLARHSLQTIPEVNDTKTLPCYRHHRSSIRRIRRPGGCVRGERHQEFALLL